MIGKSILGKTQVDGLGVSRGVKCEGQKTVGSIPGASSDNIFYKLVPLGDSNTTGHSEGSHNSARSAILFIHELKNDMRMWDEQRDYFLQSGLNLKEINVSSLLFVDLPGHGNSKLRNYSSYISDSSRLIYDLIVKLNISSLKIVGLGYGALEGLYLSDMIKNPDRYSIGESQKASAILESIVLVAPFLLSPENISPVAPLRTLMGDSFSAVEEFIYGVSHDLDNMSRVISEKYGAPRSFKMSNGEINYIHQLFSSYIRLLNDKNPGVIDNLSDIPLGIILGKNDLTISPDILSPIAELMFQNNVVWKDLNSKSLYIIDNADHFPNVANPNVFNEVLYKILQSFQFTLALNKVISKNKPGNASNDKSRTRTID